MKRMVLLSFFKLHLKEDNKMFVPKSQKKMLLSNTSCYRKQAEKPIL